MLARYIFIRQQVSLKKKKKIGQPVPNRKSCKGFEVFHFNGNGKLTFKEDLGNIQSSFQVEMMSLGRHGKTR